MVVIVHHYIIVAKNVIIITSIIIILPITIIIEFNSKVEIIIGTCKDEGLSDFAGAWIDPDFFENVRNGFDTSGTARILGLMKYSDVTPEDVEKAHKILDAYVGGVENVTMTNIRNLIDIMTDSSMLFGVHKKIGYLLDHGMTVYQYMLTHTGQFSIAQLNTVLLDTKLHRGVAHADDLIYEWEPVFASGGWDPEAHKLSGEVKVCCKHSNLLS